jgi:hypothetical protein
MATVIILNAVLTATTLSVLVYMLSTGSFIAFGVNDYSASGASKPAAKKAPKAKAKPKKKG